MKVQLTSDRIVTGRASPACSTWPCYGVLSFRVNSTQNHPPAQKTSRGRSVTKDPPLDLDDSCSRETDRFRAAGPLGQSAPKTARTRMPSRFHGHGIGSQNPAGSLSLRAGTVRKLWLRHRQNSRRRRPKPAALRACKTEPRARGCCSSADRTHSDPCCASVCVRSGATPPRPPPPFRFPPPKGLSGAPAKGSPSTKPGGSTCPNSPSAAPRK